MIQWHPLFAELLRPLVEGIIALRPVVFHVPSAGF
jgi:hypothetical protein